MSVNPFCSLLQFVYLPIEISSSIFVIPFLLKKKNFLNERTNIRFRDNQARTDDFHHVKVILYR